MAVQSGEIDTRKGAPIDSGAMSRIAGECWNCAEDTAQRSLTVAKVVGEGLAFGMGDGAKDAWGHKKETGAKLAWSVMAGLVLSNAERGNILTNFGTKLAGVGLGGAFVVDTLNHGRAALKTMSDVWQHGETATNVGSMKKALGVYAFDTALMSAGALTSAAAVRLPPEVELRFGVPDRITSDPARALIRISGYGSSRWSAAEMEKTVSAARNGVLDGELRTAKDVEHFIAGRYVKGAHGNGANEVRLYNAAGLLEKHEPYRQKMIDMVDGQSAHTAKATIAGLQFDFITTRKIRAERSQNEEAWILPSDKTTIQAARARIDELFSNLRGNVENFGKPGYLAQTLDSVAEMEWLNAQTWRYPRGSAGVSQLEARTWMELAGIDSGRYKTGVDPNMEALTKSLPDFKAAYPSFFDRAPRYFSGYKLDRTLLGLGEEQPAKPVAGTIAVPAN